MIESKSQTPNSVRWRDCKPFSPSSPPLARYRPQKTLVITDDFIQAIDLINQLLYQEIKKPQVINVLSFNDDFPVQRYRGLNLLGLLCCIGAIAFAVVYLQQRLGLDPCPLCLASRVMVLGIGALFLLAWLHNPKQLGQRCYALLGILLSLTGIALNLRHIWLQNLPKDKVPECGPGLEYMLQNFPLQEALASLLSGSGECAEIQWQLLGMSLPQQTLMLFLLLLLIQVVQFRKKRRRSYFK